ncbi:hypothetical protein V8C86DRAFT_1827475 [Haematococcus lacustris]
MFEIVVSPSGEGCVWSAEGAVAARRDHGLLGSLVGGVAQFKSQNLVHGLPLLLQREDVALAVQQGWASVLPPSLAPHQTRLLPPALPGRVGQGSGAQRRSHNRPQEQQLLAAYYTYYELRGAYGLEAQRMAWQQQQQQQREKQQPQQPQQPQEPEQQEQQQQQQQRAQGQLAQPAAADRGHLQPCMQLATASQQVEARSPEASGAGQAGIGCQGAAETPWQAAVREGGALLLPVTWQQAAVLQGGRGEAAAAEHVGGSPPELLQGLERCRKRMRYTLFSHLHDQGFALSAGPKFGCDLLAYPEDPCLVHAQYAVRLCDPDTPIDLTTFKAAARGSHAARKHLVLATMLPPSSPTLASADDGPGSRADDAAVAPQPCFISVAPELSFGHGR